MITILLCISLIVCIIINFASGNDDWKYYMGIFVIVFVYEIGKIVGRKEVENHINDFVRGSHKWMHKQDARDTLPGGRGDRSE